jgi:hypothetical protein
MNNVSYCCSFFYVAGLLFQTVDSDWYNEGFSYPDKCFRSAETHGVMTETHLNYVLCMGNCYYACTHRN